MNDLPDQLPELVRDVPQLPALAKKNAGTGTFTRATNDIEAVQSWLENQDVPATRRSYQTQAGRLLMWCESVGKGANGLQSLTVEDLQAFRAFLRNPCPAEFWCLQPEPRKLEDGRDNPRWFPVRRVARRLPDGKLNPDWRPFVENGLSEGSAKQSETILNGLFTYLCAIFYLRGNPWLALKKGGPKPLADIERWLPATALAALIEQIEAMPKGTPRELAKYHRARFTIRFLFYSGLRRFEFCGLRTGALVEKWGTQWLKVTGKGNKAGLIPLQDSAVNEIKIYRESLGLSPWPTPEEDTPLLRDLWGKRPVGVSALHELVTGLCQASPDPRVRKASSHWFRHTCASHMLAAGAELLSVRESMRHSSIATTSKYLHVDLDRLHADAQKLKLPGST